MMETVLQLAISLTAGSLAWQVYRILNPRWGARYEVVIAEERAFRRVVLLAILFIIWVMVYA